MDRVFRRRLLILSKRRPADDRIRGFLCIQCGDLDDRLEIKIDAIVEVNQELSYRTSNDPATAAGSFDESEISFRTGIRFCAF